jgi:hypothetical protein
MQRWCCMTNQLSSMPHAPKATTSRSGGRFSLSMDSPPCSPSTFSEAEVAPVRGNQRRATPEAKSKPLPVQVIHQGAANSRQFTTLKRALRRRETLEDSWVRLIHEAAAWTFALTVTFRRYLGGQSISRDILEKALSHMLRVLDVACFGRHSVKRGRFVGSAVVIGWGSYGDHPHSHLALATPPGMTKAEFIENIEFSASRTQWIARERVLVPYSSSGWARYLVGHGAEQVVLPLLRSPKADLTN